MKLVKWYIIGMLEWAVGFWKIAHLCTKIDTCKFETIQMQMMHATELEKH